MRGIYKKKARKSEILAQRIARDLAAGMSRTGERLAAARELCATYATNTLVLNQALAILESKGIVDRRPRRGVYLKRVPDSEEIVAEKDVGHEARAEVAMANPFMRAFEDHSQPLGFYFRRSCEMRFYTVEATTRQQMEAWREVIALAERALSNVKINLVEPGQIKNARHIAESATPIDVVTGTREHFPGQTARRYFKGFGLDELADRLRPNDYYPLALEAFSWDDKIYGVPLSVIALLRYRGRKGADGGKKFPYMGAWLELIERGIPFFDRERLRFDFQGPDIRGAIEDVRRGFEVIGALEPNARAFHEFSFRQMLANGLLDGAVSEANYASYLLPLLDDARVSEIAISPWREAFAGHVAAEATCLMINRHCDCPEQALEFALFCASPEPQRVFASRRANFPAHIPTAFDAARRGVYPAGAAAVAKGLVDKSSYINPIVDMAIDGRPGFDGLGHMLLDYFHGRKSLEAVLTDCEDMANREMERRPEDFAGVRRLFLDNDFTIKRNLVEQI